MHKTTWILYKSKREEKLLYSILTVSCLIRREGTKYKTFSTNLMKRLLDTSDSYIYHTAWISSTYYTEKITILHFTKIIKDNNFYNIIKAFMVFICLSEPYIISIMGILLLNNYPTEFSYNQLLSHFSVFDHQKLVSVILKSRIMSKCESTNSFSGAVGVWIEGLCKI